jgi:hypothetical protein
MSSDEIVGRIAANQHGLVARQQAIDAGLTPSAIQHRRRTGRWISAAPGVYLIHGSPFTWHTRLLAACLSLDGVASHRSAAALHEVRGFRPGQPEITVRRRSGHRRLDVRVHESLDLGLTTPTKIAGIPTTNPARLAVDLGAVVSFDRYEAAVDDLLARKLLTWDDALDMLLSHSKQGRNGVGALRALLTERYGSDVSESALEQAFERGFRARGLPHPITQIEVADAAGFIARLDFGFPERMLLMELDSVRYHLNAEAFEADRRKRNRLRVAGWLLLEYTWDMVIRSPDATYRQIMEAYHARPAHAASSARDREAQARWRATNPEHPGSARVREGVARWWATEPRRAG